MQEIFSVVHRYWYYKKELYLELYTILILAAWPVLVLIYHVLVLVGRYFGRYF
jgi:hypothetical protein